MVARAKRSTTRHEICEPTLTFAKPVRVLVVDDDPAICKLVSLALSDAELHVESASDSEQIAMRLQAKPSPAFDLVLLDYVLPGLQPQQVLGWLSENQPRASIIMITGQPSVASAVDGLRARAFDYITKPFSVADLRHSVMRCLESNGLLRTSESALRHAIGAVVRDRRKSLGLTLADLTAKTGLSVAYLSQIELGKNTGSVETLYRVCLALRWKLSELFELIER